jgi:phage tail-like protein
MADYPLPVFHFRVEWGGTNLGFAEASGLKVETTPIEYRDGVSPNFSVVKMPGLIKAGDITLKRGVVSKDNEFFSWFKENKLNKAERRDITISLLDEEHNPVMVWKVTNAFPIRIESPGLKATGNEVAIETLVLAHEGVTIENG